MHGLLAAGIWNACRLSSGNERQAIIMDSLSLCLPLQVFPGHVTLALDT